MKHRSQLIDTFISLIYLSCFIAIFVISEKKLSHNDLLSIQVWLTSGILYLILGKYFLEKYFATPINIFANSLGIIIALIFDINNSIVWILLISYMSLICLLSFIVFLTAKRKTRLQTLFFKATVILGKSDILFSLVFLVYSYLYLAKNGLYLLFMSSLVVWIDLVNTNIIEKMVYSVLNLKSINKTSNYLVGTVEQILNRRLYIIKLIKHIDKNSVVVLRLNEESYVVCKVISELNSTDINKVLIMSDGQSYSADEVGFNKIKTSILLNNFEVYLLKDNQVNTDAFKNFENEIHTNISIGYVIENSNIDTITFMLFNEFQNSVFEGKIVNTSIAGNKVLYQILDAKTKRDEFGNIIVIAKKLGFYDVDTHRLKETKWLPAMFSLVTLVNSYDISRLSPSNAIGILPGTNFDIALSDTDRLVTYNTAILGILGIGKSCLAFELIQKVANSNIKVICIDITNQYASYNGLYKYLSDDMFLIDNDVTIQALNKDKDRKGGSDQPSQWGNLNSYINTISNMIQEFINGDKMVMIINPNMYLVTKPATQFRISENTEVSLVEKVRYISEAVFESVKSRGLCDDAKCLIVFEEAHSLIPEFNAVVIKGDEIHANAISKVILQGRKYGLGSLLVTQRTANISKSALNQCNTIFAMKCYDDTSKIFLNNYIGADYSELLSTLEDRHAIVVGRGIDCKMPVIVTLNDKSLVERN